MGIAKKLAYRIRTLREAAGLSQEEVAQKAELSLSLITKMEQGRKADPRASTLLALAGALGVRAGQLIEDLTKPPEGAFPKKKGKKKKKRDAATEEPATEAAPPTESEATEEPAMKIAKPKKKKKKEPALPGV
jgi:transcriptional regulator with XRE-family HTH domain